MRLQCLGASILESLDQLPSFYTTYKDVLERTQKSFCKRERERYTSYEEALQTLNLDTLKERRVKLATKFAKGCQFIPVMKDIFPAPRANTHDLRNVNPCDVKFASGQRLYKSTVPTLQRMLNRL